MLSLLALSLAFCALTLLVVGVLACCLRQRSAVARKTARERTGSAPAVARTATEEE
jgi:hypothetical protein